MLIPDSAEERFACWKGVSSARPTIGFIVFSCPCLPDHHMRHRNHAANEAGIIPVYPCLQRRWISPVPPRRGCHEEGRARTFAFSSLIVLIFPISLITEERNNSSDKSLFHHRFGCGWMKWFFLGRENLEMACSFAGFSLSRVRVPSLAPSAKNRVGRKAGSVLLCNRGKAVSPNMGVGFFPVCATLDSPPVLLSAYNREKTFKNNELQ